MWCITSKCRSKTTFARKRLAILLAVVLLGAGGFLVISGSANRIVPRLQRFPDPNGAVASLHMGGPTATKPFYQDLGRTGRRSVTWLQPRDAWSITPTH